MNRAHDYAKHPRRAIDTYVPSRDSRRPRSPSRERHRNRSTSRPVTDRRRRRRSSTSSPRSRSPARRPRDRGSSSSRSRDRHNRSRWRDGGRSWRTDYDSYQRRRSPSPRADRRIRSVSREGTRKRARRDSSVRSGSSISHSEEMSRRHEASPSSRKSPTDLIPQIKASNGHRSGRLSVHDSPSTELPLDSQNPSTEAEDGRGISKESAD